MLCSLRADDDQTFELFNRFDLFIFVWLDAVGHEGFEEGAGLLDVVGDFVETSVFWDVARRQ